MFGQHHILNFLKNLYKIPPIEAFPARVDATCDLISVRRWWPFSLVCTGKASFYKIATHCRHLQTPKQKKMCSVILSALLSPSACGAGCWVEHGTYSVEPRKPSLFSSCKALVRVQEVISLSISQPSGNVSFEDKAGVISGSYRCLTALRGLSCVFREHPVV